MNRATKPSFDGWGVLVVAAALVWTTGTLSAQPPDLPELPADLAPPTFDLGSSVEAQAEQARTQDQPTVVRNPKPVDLNRLVMGLTIFVLSVCIGREIAAKVPISQQRAFLSGLIAASCILLVAALLVGSKVAAGASKSHPIPLYALGFLAIVLAAVQWTGAFGLTRQLLGERKRGGP
jgi:NAD/NADP transhydrogenase alpha subunit